MIRAYHAIFTTYGFWLPNDPRGSWSDFVGSWELFRFGRATKTDTRRSVAAKPHNKTLREAAKAKLKYPEVHFDGRQALAIVHGFAAAFKEHEYRLYACSILPEHVHIVIERCDRTIETIVTHLKSKATQQLNLENRHPLAHFTNNRGDIPTPWAAKCWKCFLNTDADIARAIQYVEINPIKEHKRPQHWPFVLPWSPAGSKLPG
jgi:REP element-mobilizing transposase RayT